MKLKFVNLTGATLKIRGGLGEMWPLPPDGTVAHLRATVIEMAGGLPPFLLSETVYEIFGLPDPVADTIFIVSSMVADRVTDRDDVVAPGEVISDDIGMPIGYNGLKTSGGGL